MAEHATVNRGVTGSSPVGGAIRLRPEVITLGLFLFRGDFRVRDLLDARSAGCGIC